MPWSNQGGGPWGVEGVGEGEEEKVRGVRGRSNRDPPPPDLEEFLRRSQDKLRNVLPGGNLGGKGLSLIVLAALAIWGFSGFFRVEPDELGVVLRFGKYVRDVEPGPQLSPAISDRVGAHAQGHACQPDRDRHAVGRGSASRHHDPRRAGGKPDAHRRREHRRCRLHGVLADQAQRRQATICSTSSSRKAR